MPRRLLYTPLALLCWATAAVYSTTVAFGTSSWATADEYLLTDWQHHTGRYSNAAPINPVYSPLSALNDNPGIEFRLDTGPTVAFGYATLQWRALGYERLGQADLGV